MPLSFTIGETLPADEAQIPDLYASAFPEEDLVPLVEALLPEPGVLSLSARIGAQLIGHVLFTRGALEGRPVTVALLGPDTGGDYDDLAFALPANASATYCKRKMPAATERLGEVAQVWEAE